MMPVRNKRLTSIVGMCEIVCHQRAFEIPIYWSQRARESRKRGQAVAVLEYTSGHGEAFEQGLYYDTLL
jgi:hypothetical protein